MSRYDYFRPQTIDEVFELKAQHPRARFIAGGTDLLVQLRDRALAPPALISLRSVEGLDRIDLGETVRLGAACTIADLIENAELGRRYPILVQAAGRLGSPQIRSVATVGGNLSNGSPCADTAQALLALEARAVIEDRAGERTVPLANFFTGPKQTCLGPNEVLTGILLDPPDPDVLCAFIKKGRVRMDIAVASLALLVVMDGGECKKARVAAGSVAPVPMRLTAVEEVLEGAEISKEVIARARDAAEQTIAPITDVRATADYRRRLIGVFVQRALTQWIEGGAR